MADNSHGLPQHHPVDERTPSKKILWDAPPPLPDSEKVIFDVSCQGTIGLALQQALCEESDNDDNEGEQQEDEASTPRIKLDKPAINQILLSFGRAIVQSQQDQHEMELKNVESKTAASAVPAPAALLRGRVDHFNRHGGKWRLMVHDAQIIARKPLERNRRKRERPSLWNAMKEGQSEPAKIPRLEILAYNDIE